LTKISTRYLVKSDEINIRNSSKSLSMAAGAAVIPKRNWDFCAIRKPTLGLYKSLFKQTAIYGLATVLPRMLSFLLVRLYTGILPTADYGEVSVLLAYMVFFNVILSYGMETAFFRFYNSTDNKQNVVATS